nr:hypothetical protein [Tanacetum cinerariifolium]
MSNSKFAEVHNMVAFLSKPTESKGFEQIIDFLNAHFIKYALTVNPIIYASCIEQFWATTKVKNINREAQLHAKVVGKKVVISEASIRRDLQFRDERGVDCLPNKLSVPTESVVDEAVNEEMDDSLERATTTATSLDAEQENGNIAKTQSKATPNESSSQGTDSSCGPRCQKTMRDTSSHTRYKRVSKISNDLSLKVLDLEDELKRTKTAQQTKIDGLERRVKKLEKRNKLRTYKLKRLYKVGLTARVISSSDDEGLGKEDASKQRRIIDDLDVDEDITLVNDQEMFDADNDLQGEEVVVEQEVIADKEPSVDDAHVSVAATTITTDDITLAKALEDLKSLKPKIRGIVIKDNEEPSESRTTTTSSSKKSHD